MTTAKEKYEVAESKVDSALRHLAHIKYTAVVIAVLLILDIWFIV